MVGGKYMKEQEKQIKEMAKEIGNTWLVDLEGNTKDVCEVLDEVDINNIARELYDKNYRKLHEDSVVLSREEICELKCQAEEDFNKAYDLGSKETAEKIFKMLISKLDSNQFLSGKRIIMEVDVENLAKQFDVEIE